MVNPIDPSYPEERTQVFAERRASATDQDNPKKANHKLFAG
jgi:hypothetical protein